ncbi:MAG TPA: hypothetical protein VMH02_05030, partial [Verrucomicrobiae bacterium]|nr:hypothetical protein [Verrucomicrobiae bacterium]
PPAPAIKPLPAGFYRNADQQVVYKLDGTGGYCVVASKDQLDDYGATKLVHVVDPQLNITAGLNSTASHCPNP